MRESKKQETRQLISDVATGLFLAQGFEQTTIADIADIAAAARAAKKTVTNYFPRKEDLALDHQDAFTVSLASTVADRQAGESALSALRRTFTEAVVAADPVAGFSGPDFARMIADSPTLSARLRDLHDLREAALADAAGALLRVDDPLLAANHFSGLLLWIPVNKAMFTGRSQDTEADLDRYAAAGARVFLAAYR
ncbi:TetR/AcrR family transcriptional regulator [Streptomyces sp. JL2001]|uniref:TetR/AcrR family transcriptional regulator n=1 Tax=Streptomyces sp. JL2001 TaxID=3342488 RepID=UPI003D80619E